MRHCVIKGMKYMSIEPLINANLAITQINVLCIVIRTPKMIIARILITIINQISVLIPCILRYP